MSPGDGQLHVAARALCTCMCVMPGMLRGPASSTLPEYFSGLLALELEWESGTVAYPAPHDPASLSLCWPRSPGATEGTVHTMARGISTGRGQRRGCPGFAAPTPLAADSQLCLAVALHLSEAEGRCL